jgi:hypothetical protein
VIVVPAFVNRWIEPTRATHKTIMDPHGHQASLLPIPLSSSTKEVAAKSTIPLR